MPEIKTEIIINSDAESVWNILTDIPNHQKWNTVFRDLKGTAEVGRGIRLKLNIAGKARPFSAKVLECNQPKTFAWGSAKSPLDILISANHYFHIEALSDNKIRFIHGEKFGGLLPLLLWPLIRKIEPQYQQMNTDLKNQAESNKVNYA